MKIANFREYTGVLREIYTGEAMAETGNYYYTLMSSGKRLNQKKNKLRQKIAGLSQKIQTQAEIVRQATDKRRAGLEVNKLKKEKQALVKTLKDLQSSDHFNSLSNDAKICVCSGFLFQKYLTNEILKNNPLHFQKNSHGDLIVDASQLRHSDLFTQAAHVKDFIAAYMARYPELESLQLNNPDLSDNKVIYLPKSIKYLAFYQCKFGEHPHMDLSGFENLRELRLNESDLSKIKKITLPLKYPKLCDMFQAKFLAHRGQPHSSCAISKPRA